ncbi:hypothetical protein F7R21_00705 [Burkholderia latens]|uniref:Uncharacterized protein n=1 Tax=Burkholderia latens TaxID=488446 RepID=A0A6H9T636_9BURK|nr:hypothetical protein F7R21_00705 [Burkholderia latens]
MFLLRQSVRQYRPNPRVIAFPENMGIRSISKMSGVELAVPPILDMPFGKQSRRVAGRRGAVNAIRMRTC